MKSKKDARLRRAKRSRHHIKRQGYEKGIARFCLMRTPRHIYAQVISSVGGQVLASASSLELRGETVEGGKIGVAKAVGKLAAERAKAAGVTSMACDRAGFRYHGRIAALVDAAREEGIQI